MHRDLRQYFCWSRSKRDIVDFVSWFLSYQQVMYQHQKPGGVTQRKFIPERKWEHIAMEFVVGFL